MRGRSPRTREGRLGPTARKSSGQWSAVSGQRRRIFWRKLKRELTVAWLLPEEYENSPQYWDARASSVYIDNHQYNGYNAKHERDFQDMISPSLCGCRVGSSLDKWERTRWQLKWHQSGVQGTLVPRNCLESPAAKPPPKGRRLMLRRSHWRQPSKLSATLFV